MKENVLYKKDFLVRGKEIRTKADGPYTNGKYAGWIDSMICSGPIYNTEEDAIRELEPIAAAIRKCHIKCRVYLLDKLL